MMGNEVELTKLEGAWGNPFVILGMPRTGSTLLLTSLQQHPDIWAHGELLHLDETQRATRHAIRRTDGTVIYYDGESDPMAFLMRWVFSYEAITMRKARAVGFKLFMEQASPDLLHRLQFMGVRVIHITRANLLNILVSRRLAEITHTWEGRAAEAASANIFLDPKEVLGQFLQMRRWNQKIFDLFGSLMYCRVEYETLSSDYQNCMNKIFRFLGVSPMAVAPATEKQGKDAKWVVRNYEALRAYFAGSEYEQFFSY